MPLWVASTMTAMPADEHASPPGRPGPRRMPPRHPDDAPAVKAGRQDSKPRHDRRELPLRQHGRQAERREHAVSFHRRAYSSAGVALPQVRHRYRCPRRVRLVAEGDGLENRCGAQASPWVRIPHPPPRGRFWPHAQVRCRRSLMRAVVIDEPGGPEVLEVREVADPVPADGRGRDHDHRGWRQPGRPGPTAGLLPAAARCAAVSWALSAPAT